MDLRRILALHAHGNAATLITLIGVTGSSYRRPGARLLIAADGAYAGSISGGCLEADLLKRATWLTRNGPTVERYSTLFDDTSEIPYGLGCGGTVDLLLEPATTPEYLALIAAMQASLHGETRRIATQLPSANTPLLRCIFNAHGEHIFRSDLALVNPAEPFFDEILSPPQRLIVIGAGDDAQPLIRLAALLGWRTIVLDGRQQWAIPARFPEADHVLCTTAQPRDINSDDAVILMTHSYEQDRDWLTTVLPQTPRYLGLLGARHRSSLLITEAAAALDWPIDRACQAVFAPVGLDLGGDGPEAIALSTIAEIQACIQGKLPHSRRLTPAIVTDQLARNPNTRYTETHCTV